MAPPRKYNVKLKLPPSFLETLPVFATPTPKSKSRAKKLSAEDKRAGTPPGSSPAPPEESVSVGKINTGPKELSTAGLTVNTVTQALDKSGKPCRRWKKAPMQFKTFSGFKIELGTWKPDAAAQNIKPDTSVPSEKSPEAVSVNVPTPKESSTQANHAIATKQQLFVTDPVTPGSVFFLPHGTRVFNKLVGFMKNQQLRYGFHEVITPLIYKTKLWEQSGHWENYKDDMFKVVGNDISKDADPSHESATEPHADHGHDHAHGHEHEYGLKPMNCPGHCMIYAKFDRSYNELPIRYSDFSSLHRNEASGALSGLTRVRRFHQDDGHIFCEVHQINQEITNTINMIKDTYAAFGIDSEREVEFFLSTRPEKYMGELATWEAAEQQLTQVLNACTDHWQVKEGDGAFYGPKIDVLLTDAFGKKHQVGTIQLDFQLPARFALKYTSADGSRENQPIMVHRAVFGSLERFFAILLDHYQGKWPFWINPRQAIVVPVSDRHHSAADTIQRQLVGDIVNSDSSVAPLTGYNFHVDVDKRSDTVGTRIKDALQKGYSYIIMIGDKDIANNTISVRTRDDRKVENLSVEELYGRFVELEKTYR
ncbi:hypothetical protein JCM33374_g1352 [Metschnikowia sp. JCM 33374]|nr:hypothetical protein JCM33374_g1352 [Metschnikowia sp. JCM 33374]